jgi:hypothetical protein
MLVTHDPHRAPRRVAKGPGFPLADSHQFDILPWANRVGGMMKRRDFITVLSERFAALCLESSARSSEPRGAHKVLPISGAGLRSTLIGRQLHTTRCSKQLNLGPECRSK